VGDITRDEVEQIIKDNINRIEDILDEKQNLYFNVLKDTTVDELKSFNSEELWNAIIHLFGVKDSLKKLI